MAGQLKEFDFHAYLRLGDCAVILGPSGDTKRRLVFSFSRFNCIPDTRVAAFVDTIEQVDGPWPSGVEVTPYVGFTPAVLRDECCCTCWVHNTAALIVSENETWDTCVDTPELRAVVAKAYRRHVLLLVSARHATAPTVRLDLTRLVVIVPDTSVTATEQLLRQLPPKFGEYNQLLAWLATLGPDDALVLANNGDAFVISSDRSSVAAEPGSEHTSDAEAFETASRDGFDDAFDDGSSEGELPWSPRPQRPLVHLPRFQPHEHLLPRDTVLIVGERGSGKTTMLKYLLYCMRRHLHVATAFSTTPSARKTFSALVRAVHAKLAVKKLYQACTPYRAAAAVIVDANHTLTTSKMLRGVIRDWCQGRVLYLVAAARFDIARQLVKKPADFVVLFPRHGDVDAPATYHNLSLLPLPRQAVVDALWTLQQHEALVFDRRAFSGGAVHYLFKLHAPPSLPHFNVNRTLKSRAMCAFSLFASACVAALVAALAIRIVGSLP